MKFLIFIRIILLTSVLLNLPPPNPAHVVFEEFGTMGGSVSYMHVTLHVNITHVSNLVKEFSLSALQIQDTISNLYNAAKKANNTTSSLQNTLDKSHIITTRTISNYVQAAKDIQTEINNLRGIMPETNQQHHPGRLIYRENRDTGSVSEAARKILKHLSRKGMSIPPDLISVAKGVSKTTKIFKGLSPLSMSFSIAKGVFGTFMGLYNTYQMEKMRRELKGVIEKQNKVIEVLEDHQVQLTSLQQEMDELQAQARMHEAVRLPALQASLVRGINIIKTAMKQCVHAVQQAHHHRLAIDYYDPETLKDIYDTIKYQAKEAKYKLLTRYPSDLFQLEVSYMFDGEDVVLFLHVPMVPEDSLLTLYRLKPFPIPFSETMALLPRPSTALLALSNRVPRAMTHLEHADLIDCHQVNQVYLCERHGVLQNHIKSSCLGALFEQDIPSARQVCDLELVPYAESVLQLKNNWFLIYSPIMFTAYMKCLNDSTEAKPVQVGVQQHFVDPSCSLELRNHTLTSEFSMKLDAEITYFPWRLADLKEFSITEEDIKAALADRTTAGERNLFLADVLQHKHFSSRIPPKIMVISGVICTAIIAIIFLIGSLVGTQRIMAFRRRMRRIRTAVENIQPIIRTRPSSRHHSRRPSLAQLIPGPAPPIYPGLPSDQEPAEQYESLHFDTDRLSHSLHQLSRAASKIGQLSQSSVFQTRSAPGSRSRSRRSSGHSMRRLFSTSMTDHESSDPENQQSEEPARSQGSGLYPTPLPRTKTPSYLFLKATAN